MTRRCIVIGEGIAGQATARALCRAGAEVIQISSAPFFASESASRHDGIDAALGEDDSIEQHAADLRAAAGEGANPAALEALARAAPRIVAELGIPLERDRKGKLSLVRLPGSSVARTAHAGSLTALHLSRRLERELAAHRRSGRLTRALGADLVDLVQNDAGRVIGIVTRSFATGEHEAWSADAICLATGGCAGLFSAGFAAPSLGAALGIAAGHGARLTRGLRASPAPFAWKAAGFVRRLPSRLSALGAKVEAGLLDLSDLDRAPLRAAVGPVLSNYQRHTGRDPYTTPIPMVEAPDRSLGGLWVGFDDDERNPCNHATSLPGLWAVGGAIGLYFGRNPGSGTPLLAALFGAERAAAAMLRAEPASGEYDSLLDEARERAVRRAEELLGSDADPTPYALRDELVRSWQGFAERLAGARTGDESPIANASLRLLLELHAITPLLAGWGGCA